MGYEAPPRFFLKEMGKWGRQENNSRSFPVADADDDAGDIFSLFIVNLGFVYGTGMSPGIENNQETLIRGFGGQVFLRHLGDSLTEYALDIVSMIDLGFDNVFLTLIIQDNIHPAQPGNGFIT